MEFDHIFIAVDSSVLANEVSCLLKKAGFTQGSDNVHAGQGTANKRFFFQNAFIELLYPNPYLSDEEQRKEMLSHVTKDTKLYERIYKLDNASPFGLCVRSNSKVDTFQVNSLPFDNWQYYPKYLPKNIFIPIAKSYIHEPMWFYLNSAKSPVEYDGLKKQPLLHANGCEKITNIEVAINCESLILSEGAHYFDTIRCISVNRSNRHSVTITFDNQRKNKKLMLLNDLLVLNF